jgi:predicted Zn finger-like uncharacterized protein
MILQCPACNARYAVPDHAIGANGRTVRCVKCAHEWFVSPPQTTGEKLEELLKVPEKPVLKPIPRKSSLPAAPKEPSLFLAVILLISASLALVTTLVAVRPSWFSLQTRNPIILSDLALEKQTVEKGVEYAVKGKLVNIASEAIEPPMIRITLVDNDGNPLQYWEPSMPKSIAAHDALPFNFGPLTTKFTRGDRIVVELGNKIQLALRRKP